MRWQRWFLAGAAALAAGLVGCGGGGGIGGTGTSPGTLRLAITDAPGCGYDAVHVTIDRIRVNQNANAGDVDSGWSEIVLSPAKRVELLSLSNGVLEELGQTALPSGTYTQLRLVLAPNDAANPLANSVTPTGSAETALTTPSAQQSGLKLNVDIDVASNQLADFVLDFNACKSIVKRGSSGQYNLKPVINVIPRLSAAGMRVVGYLDPAIAQAGAEVSLQLNGLSVKATQPDATGQFTLYPVLAGSYDLVITSGGHATVVLTGVPVIETADTYVNAAAQPIVPPIATSAPRAVAGTVTPAGATVRALQTLTGGPTVEVAWASVDAGSGAFAFALPVDALVRAAYGANAGTVAFASDAGAAAKYTIEAAFGGATKTQPVDVAGAVPPLSFIFP